MRSKKTKKPPKEKRREARSRLSRIAREEAEVGQAGTGDGAGRRAGLVAGVNYAEGSAELTSMWADEAEFEKRFDPFAVDTVLGRIAAGATVFQAVKDQPITAAQFMAWVSWDCDPRDREIGKLGQRFERALKLRAEMWACELVKIADDCFADAACVAKARLQIDVRKYLMSKDSARFRDRTVLEGGDVDKPIRMQYTPERLRAMTLEQKISAMRDMIGMTQPLPALLPGSGMVVDAEAEEVVEKADTVKPKRRVA